MGSYLNPGNEKFYRAINSEIYVDKTGLIGYTNKVLNTMQQNLCVSRPRRFGKSMAADMLTAYYSRGCDSKELFQGLKIAYDQNFEKYLNKYNTIFINVQEILSRTSNIYKLIDRIQRIILRDIQREYPEIDYFDKDDLSECMQDVYEETGIPFVMIFDEWDCIFREYKNDKEAQEKYLDFLRDTLKDKRYIQLVYMTGILPIKKYGTHSALNMFSEYSMTNARQLAQYVGFTEEEVQELCVKYHMNFDGLKDDVLSMMVGEKVSINTGGFTNDMVTFHSKDDVLTLLIHLGYLAYDFEDKCVYIQNNEVRGEYVNAVSVSDWGEVSEALRNSAWTLRSIWERRPEQVSKGIEQAHFETLHLQYNDENALSYTISIALYAAKNFYHIYRELPTGKGFVDLVFIPRKRFPDKPALIVELKWDKTTKGAIEQIKNKQYFESLKEYQGNLLLVGINYDKDTREHQCEIEEFHK